MHVGRVNPYAMMNPLILKALFAFSIQQFSSRLNYVFLFPFREGVVDRTQRCCTCPTASKQLGIYPSICCFMFLVWYIPNHRCILLFFLSLKIPINNCGRNWIACHGKACFSFFNLHIKTSKDIYKSSPFDWWSDLVG